jgi:hypothetical protein
MEPSKLQLDLNGIAMEGQSQNLVSENGQAAPYHLGPLPGSKFHVGLHGHIGFQLFRVSDSI